MTRKKCTKCGEQKLRSGFSRHFASADGRRGECKECRKIYLRQYRANNLERALEAQREWRAQNPDRVSEHRRAQEARNPKRRTVYNTLDYALRSGKIKKGPCEVCGDGDVHGHHDDYTKPLKVRWLCSKHHRERHKEIRTAKPGTWYTRAH